MKAKHLAPLEAAIASAHQALEIYPDFSDAMGAISSLLRARAYLLDTPAQFRQTGAEAQEWLTRSIEVRRRSQK